MNRLAVKTYPIHLKRAAKILSKLLFRVLFLDTEQRLKLFNRTDKIIAKYASHFGEPQHVLEAYNSLKKDVPNIRAQLDLDALAFERNDPAVKALKDVYIAYPGFYAIALYRLAHHLHINTIALLPRLLTEYAHSVTGIDIHPGAQIGTSFFIDHGTGVVIGETSIIGDNVSMYQGVTLGGIKVRKEEANIKRHPTIENNVTLYANATILGGTVVIGAYSVIGANVCVTQSIPANSVVIPKNEIIIKPKA